jgi:hypothetical protein
LKKKSTQAMEIFQLFTLTAHPIDTSKVMVRFVRRVTENEQNTLKAPPNKECEQKPNYY